MKFYNSDINELVAEAIINCKELSFGDMCTLSCKNIGATKDADGTINPPRNIIEVKKEAQNPENNIYHLLAAAYSITNIEAQKVTTTWLKNISTKDKDGTVRYTISGVGEIIVSPYNSKLFKADRKLLSSLNFLGKESANTTLINETEMTTSNEIPNLDEFKTPAQEPVAASAANVEETQETISETQPQKDGDKEEGNGPKWKKYTLVLIILLMLATIAYLALKNNEKPKEVIREVEVEKVVVDTVYIQQPVKIDSISNGKYQVICGAFDLKENGDNCVVRFKARGYAPYMQYVESKKLYFVSLGGFTELKEAQTLLNEVVLKVYEEDGYWIYNSNYQQ